MLKNIQIVHSNRHWSRCIDYDTLIPSLEKEVSMKYVVKKKHPDYPHLVLYNYTSRAMKSKDWTKARLISRGIIIDTNQKQIIATPFPKFFNYGEAPLPDSLCIHRVFDKLDGSLGIVYYYDNQWHVSTRGSFTSDQSAWGMNYLKQHPEITDKMDIHSTYLFEIIYPDNKIVIDYPWSGLVMLGAYNKDGYEIEYHDLQKQFGDVCRFPTVFDFNNLDDIIQTMEDTNIQNKEGYVIQLQCGIRFKAKLTWYINLVKTARNLTPKTYIQKMVSSKEETIEQFIEQCIDEQYEEFQCETKDICQSIYTKFTNIVNEIKHIETLYNGYSRKMIALEMKKCNDKKIIPLIHLFLFFKTKDEKVNTENAWKINKVRSSILKSISQMKIQYTSRTSTNLFDE